MAMTREQIALGIKIFYGLLVVGSGVLGTVGTVDKSSNLKIIDDKDTATSLQTYGFFSFCLLTTFGACVLCCILPSQKNRHNTDEESATNNENVSMEQVKKMGFLFALLTLGSGGFTALGIANKYGLLNNMNDDTANYSASSGAGVFTLCFIGLVATLTYGCCISKNRYALLNENPTNYGTTTTTPGLTPVPSE